MLNDIFEGHQCSQVKHVARRGAGVLMDASDVEIGHQLSDIVVHNVLCSMLLSIVQVKDSWAGARDQLIHFYDCLVNPWLDHTEVF